MKNVSFMDKLDKSSTLLIGPPLEIRIKRGILRMSIIRQ